MKTLAWIALCALVASCASTPYRDRVIVTADGTATQHFFSYGNFCGPGIPALKEGGALINHWPPLDDVDSICYAHDQCYAVTFDHNDNCDRAFVEVLNNTGSKFQAEGCWGLANDMIDAFFAKTYGRGDTASGTFAVRATQTTLGVPFALFLQAIKFPMNLFSRQAEEGSCFVGSASGALQMIGEFEEAYRIGVLKDRNTPISIPIPNR